MSDPARTDEQVEAIAESVPEEYKFFVWPAFVLTLPMIVIGFVLAFFGWLWPSVFSQNVNWQIYMIITLYTVLAMGYDFERLMAGIIVLVILALCLLIGLLSVWLNLNIFSEIVGFFSLFDASVTPSALLQISFWLSVLYGLMLLDVRLNHCVKARGETLSIASFLSETKTFKLTGTFAPRMEMPDILEWFLFGIGGLRVTDTEGKIVHLRRIFRVKKKETVLLLMTSAVDVEKEPDRI